MNENILKAEESISSTIWTNLILMPFLVVLYVSYSLITGTITIESFYPSRGISFASFQEIIHRLYGVKDYIITFSVILVVWYFLNKSNREWEEKYFIEDAGNKEENLEESAGSEDSKEISETLAIKNKKYNNKKRLTIVQEDANEEKGEEN
jgi:hypothetical protein